MAKAHVEAPIQHDIYVEKEDLERFYGYRLDPEQEVLRDAIWNPERKIIIVDAKAGTGKTFVSIGTANLLVQYKYYKHIYYLVSPVQEVKQGYLPGSIEEKSAPYMDPLYEALIKINLDPSRVVDDPDNIQAMKNGTTYITCKPHTFLRGTTFENSIIIIDEAQNFYIDELIKTVTRVSDNCKLLLIGHHGQCDLYKNPQNSGFVKAIFYYTDKYGKDDGRFQICKLLKNHRGWISQSSDEINTYTSRHQEEFKQFRDKYIKEFGDEEISY